MGFEDDNLVKKNEKINLFQITYYMMTVLDLTKGTKMAVKDTLISQQFPGV